MRGCLATGAFDGPLFPSSGVSSLFDVMVSNTGPFFVVGRSVGSCLHFVTSGQGGFLQLMFFNYHLTCVTTCGHRGHGFQMSGLDFSSFSNAPAAARHATAVALSSSFSSFPCASVCKGVACLGAHGPSSSPFQ